MPNFQHKTLSMAAGNGYVVSLATGAGILIVKAEAEAWIAVSGPSSTAPTAPSATPAPSAGQQASWIHMNASDTLTLGTDALPDVEQDLLQYVSVWAIGSGKLVVVAH